jgi:hypothetical protein
MYKAHLAETKAYESNTCKFHIYYNKNYDMSICAFCLNVTLGM